MDAGDLVAKSDAAGTRDTAFRIEHHPRTDIDALLFVNFVLDESAESFAVLVCIILKLTFSGFIANRTIERVID